MRRITGDLVSAVGSQVPPLPRNHRRRFGKGVSRNGQILIVGEANVIAAGNLDPITFGKAQVRHKKPADCAAIGADRKAGQRQDARAEQFQIRAFELHLRIGRIIHHAFGSDAPARVLVAPFWCDHGTRAVSRLFESHGAVGFPHPAIGREPATLPQCEQQVFHGARFELIGQLDAVGKDLVAVYIHEADIAARQDDACPPAPADTVGAHRTLA